MIKLNTETPGRAVDMRYRAYKTPADRRRAIAQLRIRGWNYFVCYLEANQKAFDKGQRYAIQYSYDPTMRGFYICY